MFNGNRFKQVTISGKTFKLQGYEDRVIEWLVSSKGVDVEEIKSASSEFVPKVKYVYRGRHLTHKPDLEVRGMLIEVKSTYTLGLTGGATGQEDWIGKNKAKAKAAHDQGLRYRVVVAGRSGVIVLPKTWYNHTTKRIANRLRTL
jgi:hypothetical protein